MTLVGKIFQVGSVAVNRVIHGELGDGDKYGEINTTFTHSCGSAQFGGASIYALFQRRMAHLLKEQK